MKAAIYEGPKKIAVKEIERPGLPSGGMVIKVESCAICGTDLKIYHHGNPRIKPPQIIGHEFVGTIVEKDEQIWDKILGINLKGTFLCCKAIIPYIVRRKSGKIINMSSQSGKRGNIWYAAYCASKFGIIGLTQSIALESAPYGININALCPGIVWTGAWDEQLAQYGRKRDLPPEKVKGYLIGKIPLGRLPELEEIAKVAVFLASDECNYMTGQAVNVTGGQQLT